MSGLSRIERINLGEAGVSGLVADLAARAPSSAASWIMPPVSAYVASSPAVWFATNYVLANRFFLPVASTFRYVLTHVTIQSGNIQVGVMALSGTDHLVGTRMMDSGVIACPAAGDVRIDCGATALAAGDYALFLWADNTTVSLPHTASTTLSPSRSSVAAQMAGTGVTTSPVALAFTSRFLMGISLEGAV